jgi:hypothetical protein
MGREVIEQQKQIKRAAKISKRIRTWGAGVSFNKMRTGERIEEVGLTWSGI